MNPRHDSPMVEMFRMFPRESAAVMKRGIELAVLCNCLLVAHCFLLVRAHWDSTAQLDRFLQCACLARFALVAPRPLYWLRTWRLFTSAQDQPTDQLVARRLVDIYAHPFTEEKYLLLTYYVWLLTVASLVLLMPASYKTALASALTWHCLVSFASIVLHRVVCVLLFFCQVRWGRAAGNATAVLEKYSRTVSWSGTLWQLGKLGGRCPLPGCGEPADCSICLGCYAVGEQLRVLACGHYFHLRCVDPWILKHRNCCPLCLLVVGPVSAAG